ncbi:hypothetical protein DYB37_007575 [Aphanomyces astaci]|uniref:Uncharacterized protein n=1 Tax=Aphanomyces astaci TaxID=112090 RepID=A0A3R6XB26_APHAT|nr:hypothetical protein DYB35_000298 [Aphanomyces astaci]RHZ12541.1 hypothetical protein DYB37_007575 [Aphanomyces astaci]
MPPPLPSLGKKPPLTLHPVAPLVGKLPPSRSRLHMFKAKPQRSKFDHSHDFDMKPDTPEPQLMVSHRYLSSRSIVDFLSDDGRGDVENDSSGRVLEGTTTTTSNEKAVVLSKELVALKSIQGRVDHVMLAFDESMAKASVGSFDSGDPMAPLTWKVGEILMATHESLTMASGFNERLFTKVP